VPVTFFVIAAVVSPLLHAYVPPPEAVKVTLPPEQIVVGPPAVIEAVVVVFTVTVWLAVAVQPLAFVTVTVYVVVVNGLAEKDAVVWPELQA
jgi:hypothetical protein